MNTFRNFFNKFNFSKKVRCAYCGFLLLPKREEILIHILNCDKRPEKAILEKSFEINTLLVGWIEHLAGLNDSFVKIKLQNGTMRELDPAVHYMYDSCEICKEIHAYLKRYHG